ncbi:MAG: hydrogenase formation protein HypD [Thermoplasmata archaeon]|nr:hydrogenase formation protein HypD [Thermoplasmata archaeon]
MEWIEKIRKIDLRRRIKIMNFCGTHEHEINRYGIRSVLPRWIELIAGPGCPVCVCGEGEIRAAISLANQGICILTYGDMMRVPVRMEREVTSLEKARSRGAKVKIVTSPLDALNIAREKRENFVFFSVGFETTTAPLAGLLENDLPENLKILTAHKLTPPALDLLIKEEEVELDGIIAPGHVSTITGSDAWKRFADYGIPIVVAGFTPEQILEAVYRLALQIKNGESRLENVYKGIVTESGNEKAKEMIDKHFYVDDAWWRGIGRIEDSGFYLKDKDVDARYFYDIEIENEEGDLLPGCSCRDIVLGKKLPKDCPLFGKVCTPDDPKGPCMVSSEGACSAWYRYMRVS